MTNYATDRVGFAGSTFCILGWRDRPCCMPAQLRVAFDAPATDRERQIDEVLAKLMLADQAGQRITTVFGRQRKGC